MAAKLISDMRISPEFKRTLIAAASPAQAVSFQPKHHIPGVPHRERSEDDGRAEWSR